MSSARRREAAVAWKKRRGNCNLKFRRDIEIVKDNRQNGCKLSVGVSSMKPGISNDGWRYLDMAGVSTA